MEITHRRNRKKYKEGSGLGGSFVNLKGIWTIFWRIWCLPNLDNFFIWGRAERENWKTGKWTDFRPAGHGAAIFNFNLRVRSQKEQSLKTALMVLCICLLMNNSWKFSNLKNPIDVSQVGIRDGDWSKSNRDVSRTEPRFKKCSKQIGKTVGDVKITAPGGYFY